MSLGGLEYAVLKQLALVPGSAVAPFFALINFPGFLISSCWSTQQHFVKAPNSEEREVTCFGSDKLQHQWSSCYNPRASWKKIPRNMNKKEVTTQKGLSIYIRYLIWNLWASMKVEGWWGQRHLKLYYEFGLLILIQDSNRSTDKYGVNINYQCYFLTIII